MLADEEGPIDLWGLLTPQVLLIIVIAILVVLAVVGGLAILAWRRARRSGALDRGRRLLRRASLTVQAQAAPTQAAREVAGLRQQLAATVEQTHASVAAALEADSPVGELPQPGPSADARRRRAGGRAWSAGARARPGRAERAARGRACTGRRAWRRRPADPPRRGRRPPRRQRRRCGRAHRRPGHRAFRAPGGRTGARPA
jgi:hypothetical protein